MLPFSMQSFDVETLRRGIGTTARKVPIKATSYVYFKKFITFFFKNDPALTLRHGYALKDDLSVS